MIKDIFESQKSNRWGLANSSVQDRKDRLRRLRTSILQHQKQIIQAMYDDFRKPEDEVIISEIFPVLEEIKYVLEHLSYWGRPRAVKTPWTLKPAQSTILYEARGLVLILSPWNYPINLSLTPLIEAVAAGNAVILKPSEKTPHTSKVIQKIIEAAFRENEVAVIQGDASVAEQLTKMPFDHIFFTGNTQIGKKVMAAAAQNLATVTLELGGKSPTIILFDANISQAARKIAWAKFMNAGQTCIAPDHVYVHDSIKEKFVAELKRAIHFSFGEDPRLSKDFARLIDHAAFARVKNSVESSLQQGAVARTKVEMISDTRYVSPIILDQVNASHSVMKEELFAPVLPIITYGTVDEVIQHVRKQEKPLALYIYGRNRKQIEKILKNTSSGGACVNHSTLQFANHNLPFGGVNHSGIGSYHGYQGFKTFSHEKSILQQSGPGWLKYVMPPYSQPHFRWLKWIVRFLTR